jgi:secreted PhoX family phosphatase
VTSNAGSTPGVPVGQPLEVEWVDLDDVESPRDDLRQQGFAKGAAVFSRGEGIWYDRSSFYFTATSGGANAKGQVWHYVPSSSERQASGWLELFLEPNDETLLDSCDNVTIAPWGDLLLCEDGTNEQFVVGVTPEGLLYKVARNAMNTSEFAGATFSPDWSTLFVNIYSPGLTLAITGPWLRAAL